MLKEAPSKFEAEIARCKEETKKEKKAGAEWEQRFEELEQRMATLTSQLEEQRVLLGDGVHNRIFPNALREGVLTKLGRKVRNWNKRYFVLTVNSMRYYNNDNTVHLGSKPSGEIYLVGNCSVEKASDKPFAFAVNAGPRRLLLYSNSASETDNWIELIQSVIDQTHKALAQRRTSMAPLRPSVAKYFVTKRGACDVAACGGVAVCRRMCTEHFEEYQKAQRSSHLFKDSYKEGLLTKMGSLVKNWKERYFTVSPTTIRYYRPDNIDASSDPQGTVDITHGAAVSICPPEAKNQPFAFSIIPRKENGALSKDRLVVFAQDEEDADEWIRAFKKMGNDEDDVRPTGVRHMTFVADNNSMQGDLIKFTRGGKGKHVKYFSMSKQGTQGIITWGRAKHEVKHRAELVSVHEGLDGINVDKLRLADDEMKRCFTLYTTKKHLHLLAGTLDQREQWMKFADKCC